MAVPPEYDVASAASVSSVGSTLGYILGSVEVARACAPLA